MKNLILMSIDNKNEEDIEKFLFKLRKIFT